MMEEISDNKAATTAKTDGATPFEKFQNLNRSLVPGSVFVTPDGAFGVKTDEDRVLSFGDNGAVDVTDIAEVVNHVEIRTQKEPLEKGALFVFNQELYQTIEDKDIVIDAFYFNTKSVVTVSPERLAFMGGVRAIGVVFMPEAKAFGGDMFQALKMLAASAGNRDGLYSLRKKEWLAAQMSGKTVRNDDGLDEMMALVANPGAAQFQTLLASQQQVGVLSSIAKSLELLVKQSMSPASLAWGGRPVPEGQREKEDSQSESKA